MVHLAIMVKGIALIPTEVMMARGSSRGLVVETREGAVRREARAARTVDSAGAVKVAKKEV